MAGHAGQLSEDEPDCCGSPRLGAHVAAASTTDTEATAGMSAEATAAVSASTTETESWHVPPPPPGLLAEEAEQGWASPRLARLERLLEDRLGQIDRKLESVHQHLLEAPASRIPSTVAGGQPRVWARARAGTGWRSECSGERRRDADEREKVTRQLLRESTMRSLTSTRSSQAVRTQAVSRQVSPEEELPPCKVSQTRRPSCGSLRPKADATDSDSDCDPKQESGAADAPAQQSRMPSDGTLQPAAARPPDELSEEPGGTDARRLAGESTRARGRSFVPGSLMIGRGPARKRLSVLMPSFWHKVVNRSEKAERVWTFFEEPETSLLSTLYHEVMGVFILMTCLIPVLQTLPDKPLSNEVYFWVSTVTDMLFLVELCVRFAVCPSYTSFFFGFYNLLDIAIIAPVVLRCAVYNSLPEDSGDITVAEGILLCIVPVMRMMKALRSIPDFVLLYHTLKAASRSIPVPMFMLSLIVMIFSSAFYVAEPRSNIVSMPHAAWLVIVTLSTVGYGDLTPETDQGRVCASLLMFSGLLFMAMPIAIVGAAFLETWKNRTRILAIGRIHRRMSQWGYTEEDLRIMFKTLDTDLNCVLDVNEFKSMVETMRLGLNDEQIVKLFNVFDANGSGELDIDEFVEGVGLNKPGTISIF